MKSRRQDVSGDHRPVKSRRRYKKGPSVVNGRANSESIPVDLVIEILSRLPAKSITKFRCVSKLWASILGRPDFGELFLTRSQARPQLLFICQAGIKRKIDKLLLFSSPQPRYSDGNSSLATASFRMKIPLKFQDTSIWIINGLVFIREMRTGKINREKIRTMVSRVCNPNTRQSLFVSNMKTRTSNLLYSYIGYDPIEKQFKVLSMTFPSYFTSSDVYQVQVLTLGTKKMSWRKVECCKPHVPMLDDTICINGVLYYQAYVFSSKGKIVVCFDMRSEKFRFVEDNTSITGLQGSTLVNYNGKLGLLVSDGVGFSGRSISFVLWILEDTEKHYWSKHSYELPSMWKDVAGDIGELDVVGMVGGNEIVFSSHTHYSLPYYVFYYNIEQNTIRRIEIRGLEVPKGDRVHTFFNHVEDIKPIDGY